MGRVQGGNVVGMATDNSCVPFTGLRAGVADTAFRRRCLFPRACEKQEYRESRVFFPRGRCVGVVVRLQAPQSVSGTEACE